MKRKEGEMKERGSRGSQKSHNEKRWMTRGLAPPNDDL